MTRVCWAKSIPGPMERRHHRLRRKRLSNSPLMGIASRSAVGSHCSLPTAFLFASSLGGIGSGERSPILCIERQRITRHEKKCTLRDHHPIAVVCFAVVLMLWSMAGTNGGGTTKPGETTGSAYTRDFARTWRRDSPDHKRRSRRRRKP